MKRQNRKIRQRIAALALGVVLTLGSVAQAADNQGTGDIAGVAADLTDSNLFSLLSSPTLALIKKAFLTSTGAALTSGASLPAGTEVDFMIYINNESDVLVGDVSMQDVLDALFLYKAGTIRVDNATDECALTACTLVEEKAIYDAAILAGVLTDAVGADSASIAGVTIDVGTSVIAGNTQQDAAANKVLALVFTVTMQ
jgi:hypothetical protein